METQKPILIVFLLLLSGCCLAVTPSDTSLIKKHLTEITKTSQYRNYKNLDQLNRTADYIQSVFGRFSDSVAIQEYTAGEQVYKNVICSFGTAQKERIVIGAHYDVCGDVEGADDNASGVVGLLELARMLKGQKLNYRVDLVAYSLEEPPFFRTEFMGSMFTPNHLRTTI